MESNPSVLDNQFEAAVKYVRQTPSTNDVPNDTKLLYYAYFKQATVGDVTTDQPSFIWFKERAKWNAWNSLKGITKEYAKSKYIELVHGL